MTQPNVDPQEHTGAVFAHSGTGSQCAAHLSTLVPLGGGSKSADITPEVEMFHLLLPLIQAATGNNLAHLYK